MTQLEARDLFRAAYENRYTWDHNFPGYTADVQLKQGDEVFTGKIQVNRNLSAEVMEVANEQVKQSIAGQLSEIALHRIRRSFEDTHGKNSFSYGEGQGHPDETGAVEILVSGKAMGDRYKVRNQEVCLVHRHIHNIVVTINTASSQQTPEGYLPERYHSVYADPKTGEKKGESEFEDHYEKVGDYYILTQRTLTEIKDGQRIATEFNFSNIKLLQPVAV